MAKRYSKVIMPGALTPTEVLTAWEAGADIVKIFPCGNVGGPKYIKALKGPFPHIEMIPTGGVNLETTGEFLKAGACAVCARYWSTLRHEPTTQSSRVQHRGHPARAELHARATQTGVPLEHAVHHHHRQERLGALVQHGHVLAATFSPPPIQSVRRAGRCCPRLGSCSGEPPTCSRNGRPASAAGPRTVRGRRGPATGRRRAVRYPDRFQTGVQRDVELGQRQFGFSSGTMPRPSADRRRRRTRPCARLWARVAP